MDLQSYDVDQWERHIMRSLAKHIKFAIQYSENFALVACLCKWMQMIVYLVLFRIPQSNKSWISVYAFKWKGSN